MLKVNVSQAGDLYTLHQTSPLKLYGEVDPSVLRSLAVKTELVPPPESLPNYPASGRRGPSTAPTPISYHPPPPPDAKPSKLAPDPTLTCTETQARPRWPSCIGRELSTASRLPSSGWGSETANMLTRQLPSQLATRSTPTTPRRGRPRSPAPPPLPPSLFGRGRRGGPPHQKLPSVNHWPGLFGLSSTP